MVPVSVMTRPASTAQATNFRHLYWDVVWFGLAFGSTLSFLAVFAARLGGAGWQIGLLTAGPALVNVLLTMPAGRWLESQSLGPGVVRTAFWTRLGLLAMVPIPLLLPSSVALWMILAVVLLMAIPGTALTIGFNALLAATVPPEARGHVVGRRNALMAGTIMLAFILCGQILEQNPFEWGYTMVFLLGAVGGAMSTFHLSRIQVPPVPSFRGIPLNDRAQPGRSVAIGDAPPRAGLALRLWLRQQPSIAALRQRVSGRFLGVMGAFFLFHFAQFLPAPLFPLFWVRAIRLDDGAIGWINAIFYLSMLVGSPLLGPMAARWGNRALAVWGAFLLAFYPLLTALSSGLVLLLVASVLGGLSWGILGGALANRLLEIVPEDDRPAHLSLYNLVLNIAVLSGTMLGPLLADQITLQGALLAAFILRLGAWLALGRWG